MPGSLPDGDSPKPGGYCTPGGEALAKAIACDADQRGRDGFCRRGRLTHCLGMNNNTQIPTVSLAKSERQRLIASVVSRKRIGSQLELAEALAKAGCQVTQATVSRDIRELRLEKTSDELGRPRYVVPGRGSRRDPRESLTAVLEQLEHPKVVGTLAGDDTCLVITAGPAAAKAVARELAAAMG